MKYFFNKKDSIIVVAPYFQESVSCGRTMNGLFFGMCTALVEEVLTCAHAPHNYQEVS